MSPLWRELDSIHIFVLNEESYGQGLTTAQMLIVSAVFGVRIKTCDLTSIACGKWCLVTKYWWSVQVLFLDSRALDAML